MAKRNFWSQLKFRLPHLLFSSRRRSTQGFTLIELLVTTAIGGLIVAGLTYIVVELMGVDQSESARSETQREMQMALDYITVDLREAVRVYSGDFLQCAGGCKPLTDYLPESLSSNSVPVLAFWKQQPFPDRVRDACQSASPPAGVNCLSGSSYALVVYSLSKANPNRIWSADNARITRYALTEFDTSGNSNPGYVNPGVQGNFDRWPLDKSRDTNLQSRRPTGSAAALVDFVDLMQSDEAAACPENYSKSPKETGQPAGVANLIAARSFYACISPRQTNLTNSDGTTTTIGSDLNQDVILYIRGNAKGRPGVTGNRVFLPTLQTRVLIRGLLNADPSQQ